MTSFDFARSMQFVSRWEGGYVNHPNDTGGATNFGVTQAVYDAWRSSKGQAKQDVRDISQTEVHAIYERDYWKRAHCHELASPLTLAVFDVAVNSGTKRAVTWLQAAVGATADGAFGAQTLAAATAADPNKAAKAICDRRERFYRAIVANRPDQGVFLKGWLRRLNDLRVTIGLVDAPAGFAPLEGALPTTPRLADLGQDDALDAMDPG